MKTRPHVVNLAAAGIGRSFHQFAHGALDLTEPLGIAHPHFNLRANRLYFQRIASLTIWATPSNGE